MANQVMTVTGPVYGEDLGFTLMHEHIFLDLMRDAWIFTNILNDPELADMELDMLRQAGGATIVDLTSGGLREYDNPIMFEQHDLRPLPPPLAVRRAAERSGLKIIMGAGWYHENYYKPRLWDLSTDQLAEEIVGELRDGMEGTDVKAGIIGEIGAQYNRLSAIEERVLRGACVSFDRMGSLPHMTDFHRHRVLASIKRLIDDGHVDRIVLSQDVCYADDLATNGGSGYAWLQVSGQDLLERKIGLTDDQWHTIMVETPRRILAGC